MITCVVWWTPWLWINMSTETVVPDTKLYGVIRRKITEWQSVIWSYRCGEYEEYVFSDATPCAFVDRYGRFEEYQYDHWSWTWKYDVFSTRYLFTKLHGVVSLKNLRRVCWWSNSMFERITQWGPSSFVISTKRCCQDGMKVQHQTTYWYWQHKSLVGRRKYPLQRGYIH
jgi:hypothetical protein